MAVHDGLLSSAGSVKYNVLSEHAPEEKHRSVFMIAGINSIGLPVKNRLNGVLYCERQNHSNGMMQLR
jgi:hypothetical protein